MRPDLASMLERLRREADILFSLQHPNIVRLFDVVETPDCLYLVMELVEGGDLFEHIARHRRLGEPEARYVFLQLVEALHIHSKGVVHRDLKPDNILVDRASSCEGRPHVKVSDFGHSKLIDDGWAVAVTQVGTPQYWAPEVRDPSRRGHGYDERVDLWSLGVVLYVMLEGTYPFESDALDKAKASLIQFARGCSRQARELALGLIQVRPEDRLALEACSRHAWVREDSGPLAKLLQVRKGSAAACEAEERFRLAGEPADLAQLRADLRQFTLTHKSAAVPTRAEVVVTWAADLDEPQRAGAREELRRLLAWNCRGAAAAPEGGAGSVASAPAPGPVHGRASAGRRAGEKRRLLTSTVRVRPDLGAGLERRASPRSRGVRVLQATGQYNLVAGDLIVSINQVSLGSLSGEDLERTFEANLRDGAALSFWRRAG
ncbi:unnamed protein product [Prorocentrum cordatum]|uniref:Protein kinase domain-containing protein n=1 Tax=Prorocentrum cordatum TaxID=2364126 RepID=A0ABN9XVX3_9DINO|nr:unnamed protein product [Polarella glacialis]